jgi:hypothetical protein
MKFIKITTNLTKEESIAFFENVSPVLKRRLFDLENEILDVTLHREPFVVFMTPTTCQELELMSLYKSIGLPIKVEDVTTEAIYGFHNTTDAEVLEAKETDWQFDELVKRFILENSSMDDVLDKISLYGIESLTESDKTFLP